MSPKETDLETIIEQTLLNHHNYQKRTNRDYNKNLNLIPQDLLNFIQTTQPQEWEKYRQYQTETDFLNHLANQLQNRSTIDLFLNKIKSHGCTFELVHFLPNNNLNPELKHLAQQNQFALIRQLHYSKTDSKNSLDLAIFLNGIPIFTAELKYNQPVEKALQQYRQTRNPNEPIFKPNRCLCHFALDAELVFITTQLKGEKTEFLPFNQGNNNGKGNPSNSQGCRTAYLWENIWQPNSILDLIKNFIHLEKNQLIFPRYHQLDSIRQLLQNAKTYGTGNSYLIQHSAGSGKTKTISWLAHQLTSLFNNQNQRVFNSVIVISDRRIINKQLQDNIRQIETVKGTVATPQTGQQLKTALQQQKQLIVCTLFLFPQVLRLTAQMANQKYAILIDEAHSSQSGETARDLKAVLAEKDTDAEDFIHAETQKRGKAKNVSYFAFTATPKNQTLETFGTRQSDGKYSPFHLYSMRQAIEEGFILDVLQNYTTYQQYYRLLQATENDPHCNKNRASYLLRQFVNLHPETIQQKTIIIIEHFLANIQQQINGKAKATIVANSRAQAVRYKQAVDEYLQQKQLDLKTLVAFSQTVEIDGINYTETSLNSKAAGEQISDSKTAEYFERDEYKILIVADKYQTGFNQPKLAAMYVDKTLKGIKAVQTLSRINRCLTGKNETFVLDFVNNWEDIKAAFQEYYTTTNLARETDPNRLYSLQRELAKFNFYEPQELTQLAIVYYGDSQNLNDIEAVLSPIVDRFDSAPEETQTNFRSQLTEYVRLYRYLSQIVPWDDAELEKLYILGHLLLIKIKPETSDKTFVLPPGIDLKYYRLEESYRGAIALENTPAELEAPAIKGAVNSPLDESFLLSQIINEFNRRYGANLTDTDKACIDEVKTRLFNNSELRERVRVNGEKTRQTYAEKANQLIVQLFLETAPGFSEFYPKLNANKELEKALFNWLFEQMSDRLQLEKQ
jgi:type I restriction enzyme R subunit